MSLGFGEEEVHWMVLAGESDRVRIGIVFVSRENYEQLMKKLISVALHHQREGLIH